MLSIVYPKDDFPRLAIYKRRNSSSDLFHYPGSGSFFLLGVSQLILLHELMGCRCQPLQLFFNDPEIQYCFDTSVVSRCFLLASKHPGFGLAS